MKIKLDKVEIRKEFPKPRLVHTDDRKLSRKKVKDNLRLGNYEAD